MFGFFRKRKPAADFLRAAGEAQPERQAESAMIQGCRDRLGPAPRRPDPADRVTLEPERERDFVERNDGLLRVLRDQEVLLARGRVFWGQLVQANKLLFERDNRFTCPANVIYSTDPFFDGRLALLASMAGGLFAQKGSAKADREIQSFVDAITNEMERVLRREMPHSYTGGRDVCFATCFIHPDHLPDGYLARGAFPVVVCPEETPAMMLLPARYWAAELVSVWRE